MVEPRKPFVHPDGRFVSIGFEGSNDTLLRVGGQPGEPGRWDVERARRWAFEVGERLDRLAALEGDG